MTFKVIPWQPNTKYFLSQSFSGLELFEFRYTHSSDPKCNVGLVLAFACHMKGDKWLHGLVYQRNWQLFAQIHLSLVNNTKTIFSHFIQVAIGFCTTEPLDALVWVFQNVAIIKFQWQCSTIKLSFLRHIYDPIKTISYFQVWTFQS